LKRRALLLTLLGCLGLAQVADAAYIEVIFHPQNGAPNAATEWAVEMISDTPIGSTGLFIPNADAYTGFASVNVGGAPIIGLPGVQATINAVEDPGAPWGSFNATWFGLSAGLLINAGPGFAGTALGPADSYLALGMLSATAADIMAGEGGESGLWTDDLGGSISASEVHYTLSEESACLTNPCTFPPPGECAEDGVTLVTYPSEGLCTDLGGGAFSCSYPPDFTDCSAQGTFCPVGHSACSVLLPTSVPALAPGGLLLLAVLLLLAARRAREL
jgi:hypothetical protein